MIAPMTINVVKVSKGTIEDTGNDYSSVTVIDTDQFVDNEGSIGFNVSKMSIAQSDNTSKADLSLASKIADIRRTQPNAMHVPVDVDVKIVMGSKDTKPVIIGLRDKAKK